LIKYHPLKENLLPLDIGKRIAGLIMQVQEGPFWGRTACIKVLKILVMLKILQNRLSSKQGAGAAAGAEAAAPIAAYFSPAPVVAVVIVGIGAAVGSVIGIKATETVVNGITK
jgi:hypothetical protein